MNALAKQRFFLSSLWQKRPVEKRLICELVGRALSPKEAADDYATALKWESADELIPLFVLLSGGDRVVVDAVEAVESHEIGVDEAIEYVEAERMSNFKPSIRAYMSRHKKSG